LTQIKLDTRKRFAEPAAPGAAHWVLPRSSQFMRGMIKQAARKPLKT
jgi:hypothetical protein